MIGTILTWLAIYLMVWWVTLFVVLPLGGNPSQHEAGVEVIKGNDPGAPVNMNLWQKAKLNSIVALVIWLVLVGLNLIFRFDLTGVIR